MNGNPHYDNAMAAYSAANANASDEFNAACRADAAIQATLALAYEQRTANLIAAIRPTRLPNDKEWLPTEGTVRRIRTEIENRLYTKATK